MAWSRSHDDVPIVLGYGFAELACNYCYSCNYSGDYPDYYHYRRPYY